MTNIYNKYYLRPNGTLIGNWYEEQCLRDELNQLQKENTYNNINNNNININNSYKTFLDKNKNINNNNNSLTKNTFIRTFGERLEKVDYTTTNDSYGNFPTNQRYYMTPQTKSFTYSNIMTPNQSYLKSYPINTINKSYINNIKINNNNKNEVVLDKNFYTSKNYSEINSFEKSNISVKDSYGGKIIEVCIKKGWLGLRNLKRFLSSFSINKSNFIDINNIQFYFINYGINLLKEDLYFIFDNFSDKKTIVDYISLLNSCIFVDDERFKSIENFIKKLHNYNYNQIFSKKFLLGKVNAKIHPEVVFHKKTEAEILNEYFNAFYEFGEGDKLISDEQMIQLMCEISVCVPDEQCFNQILLSLSCNNNINNNNN